MREKAEEVLAEQNPEALFAAGFDDAIVGVAQRFNTYVVAYDRDKCIQCLMRDGMNEEEAEEFFEFNSVGAWMGEGTPVFLHFLERSDMDA